MSDTLRLLTDVGPRFRDLRRQRQMTASQVARMAGRSRDTLHRFENGADVSLGTFLAFLSALDCALDIVAAGLPTLEEMQRRYGTHDDDD
jgi:transcriptional regulator with XRE-family HTH domain